MQTADVQTLERKGPAKDVPVVRVEHVSFAYDPGVAVLEDVSLSVRPQEFVVLKG